MKKGFQKSIAAAMTAALLMTVCTGCGSQGKGATLEVSFDNSYASEELRIDGINRMDGGIAMDATHMLVVGSDENYNQQYYLYNMEDGSTREVELSYQNSLPKDAEAWPIAYFQNDKGGLTFLYNAYSYANDEYKDLGYTLEVYDNEMNAIETTPVDLSGDFGFNQLLPRAEGGYYASMWDESGSMSISIMDDNFKVTKKIGGDMQYVQTMFTHSDGTVFVSYQDNEWNNVFGNINEETGSVEKLTIEGLPSWFNECFASKSEDYDFYITNSDAIYGIRLEAGTCTEVVNWINSDFMGDYVNNPTQLDDGRFLISAYDSDYSSSSMWLLSPRDPEELANMEIISLATLYTSNNLGTAVSNFNRTNDKYRIVVYDYNKFNSEDDWEAGMNKFESDLTSGIVADMMCVEGLPFESLSNKGLFLDLSEYADALTEDNYFTNYFDSLRYGGKLYRMGFSFSVRTMMAKTRHVGEGTKTIAEYNELLNHLPDGMTAFGKDYTKDSALSTLVVGNISSFVDVQTGTCNFNTPEFVELLEFCDSFPAENSMNYDDMSNSDWDAYWAERDYEYINDKTLFYQEWISDLKSTYRTQVQYFDTEPVTMTGFPVTVEGDNGGRFQNDFLLSISSSSKHKDECWSFFEMMLSDNYQEKLRWSIPVSKTAFDKMAEQAMKPDTYTDSDGKEVEIEFTVWRGDQEIKVPEIPQSYFDDLKNYIGGVTQSSYYDEQLYTIIDEEAGMLFAGDQSAQKAAEMIQSRMSLYLSEQH